MVAPSPIAVISLLENHILTYLSLSDLKDLTQNSQLIPHWLIHSPIYLFILTFYF